MTYTLVEHRHRFAAWAAGRAAGTKGCRFTVEEGRGLIEGTDIPSYAADWERATETPEDFDAQHRLCRETMVVQAKAKQIGGVGGCFTRGVAAKLINIYLKAAVVCALTPQLQAKPSRADIIHPPIDRLLLLALAKHAKAVSSNKQRSEHHWRKYAVLGWSNFNSDHYEDVIKRN